MRRYRRLARYSVRQWRALLLVIFATLGYSVTTVLQPWPMKILVDNALDNRPAPAAIRSALRGLSIDMTPTALVAVAAAATFALFILNSCLKVAVTWGWTAAGQRMVFDLAADVFAKLQRLSLSFHARRDVGDSLSRINADTYSVYTLTEALLVSPLQQLLTVTIVGAAAWSLDPELAVVTLATAPVLAVGARLLGRDLKHRSRASRDARAQLTSYAHQTLTAVPVVQAFDAATRHTGAFNRLGGDAANATVRSAVATAAFNQGSIVVATVGTSVVTFFGALRVIDGSLTVGSLLVFVAYLRTFQGTSKNLLATYGNLRNAAASVDRVFEIMDADEEVKDASGARPLRKRARGHVVIDDVTVGYEPGQSVLHGVTLEVEPGQLTALVGATGAGKTTIASLVPRLMDPWSGAVRIDGIDLRSIELTSLRENVAVVLQEPFLLPLSIADNIAYGRPGASLHEVQSAASAAELHDYIRTLPDGYDTVIGERGATLSGGERQRLAIARALLKDAPILVLDEPTSSLDVVTEEAVMEALERLTRGRTTFVIAHRLSTVRRAHQIALIDDGRVAELGTHPDLLASGGRYARYHAIQSSSSKAGQSS